MHIAADRMIEDTAAMAASKPGLGVAIVRSQAALDSRVGLAGKGDQARRMYSVTVYCGLDTAEVYDGCRRERPLLTRSGPGGRGRVTSP